VAYTHAEISMDSAQLPELPQGEFYWRDLIGMSVVTDKGYDLGIVDDLMETGSNDVLVVKANSKDAFGQAERLIPFLTDTVIIEVKHDAREITVDWDPGF
jgi:16S rRNA processing protein RimM